MKNIIAENTHHELLIFEGLLSLINISNGLQQSRPEAVDQLFTLQTREGDTLYKVVVRSLIVDNNERIKLSSLELLSNLSLCSQF